MPSALFTRRLVGVMFILCGVLLALGLLLRIGVTCYLWHQAGMGIPEGSALGLLIVNVLAMAAAVLLVYYGQRVMRGGRIRSGSSGKPIL